MSKHFLAHTIRLTILTSVILLLITATGSFTSPFFFLCYFLLFGVGIFIGRAYEKNLARKKHLGAEETDTLIFLSLNLKRTLVSALDSLSVVIPQEKVKSVRVNLQTLYADLKKLYRSADDLQDLIEH